jgi:hypothetical protein
MTEKNKSRREFLGKALGAVAIAALSPITILLDTQVALGANGGFIIDLANPIYADLSDSDKHFSIFIKIAKQSRNYTDIEGKISRLPYAFVVTRTSDSPMTFAAVQGYCSHRLYALEDSYDGTVIKCPNPDPGHGSTFTADGIKVKSLASFQKNLEKYQTIYNAANNTVEVIIPGLAVNGTSLPSASLLQNFPNPVKEKTSIGFTLPYYSKVTLTVNDSLGNIVAVLTDGYLAEGKYSFDFDASIFPSGTYFYHLNADGEVVTKQMTVVK